MITSRNYFGYKWQFGGCPNKINTRCHCDDNICMSAQNICLRKQDKYNKVIKAITDKGHCWTVVNETELIDLVNNNNSFIMEILGQYPKKVYFDIDCDEPEKLSLERVIEIISKYFPGECQMAISGNETDKIKSYHIVLYDYILEDDNDMQILKKLTKIINKNECAYFDWKVYTKNRAMKCINQSKPNREKQLIIKDETEKHHFINSFFTGKEQKIKIDFTSETIFDEDMYQEDLELNDIPKLEEPLKLNKNFTKEDLNDSKKLLMMAPNGKKFIHSYTWKVALFCVTNGLNFKDFWEWAKIKDDSSSRKTKWQKYHWDTICNSDFKFHKKGFIKLLSMFYPELEQVEEFNDIITKQFIDSLDIKETKIDRIEPFHFTADNKCIIFNIGMGGGKTTQTVQYLKDTNKSFIWIAPRQALVMNTHERFVNNGMNVLNYLNCGSTKDIRIKNINKSDKLLLESESLNKIDNTSKYDVLIIDEIETVLKNWDSETHIKNNLETNFLKFKELFLNCKQIILLDAFTTKHTLQFLKDLKINEPIIYGSNYKPNQKILNENFGYKNTIHKIATELDAGKKLYIFHAFKSSTTKHYSIEEMKSKLLEICTTKPKILVYHGDMNDKQKKTLYNVNDEWDKYDCILTTSSITVGVNYEGSRYDKVYLMVSGSVNNVRDIIQTSMRIRKTKEDVIELYFFDRMEKMIYKTPEFYKLSNDPIYQNLIDNIAIEKQANFIESFYKFCSLTNYDHKNIKRFVFNKTSKFINELYESKMLMSYDSIETITETMAENIQYKYVWASNASMTDKFTLNKFYFDCKFRKLQNEDRAFIWNNRLENFFKNIDCNLIKNVLKDNDVDLLFDINLNNIKTSAETEQYINENYKIQSKLKHTNQKIIKLIQCELGYQLIENVKIGKSKKTKNIQYQFTDITEQLQEMYNKLNVKVNADLVRCDWLDCDGLDAEK